MRVYYGFLCTACLLFAGCDGERIITPQETADRFEEALGDNHRLPTTSTPYTRPSSARVEGPVVVPPDGEFPVHIEAPARVPVVVHDDDDEAVVVTTPVRPLDPYTSDYRPASVVTVEGHVVGFRRIPLSHDRTGLFAKLHLGGEFPEVYLGPQHWLAEHNFGLEITSLLGVTGSRVRTVDGQNLIIARNVRHGGLTLNIREADGDPLYPVPTEPDITARDID